MHYLADQATLRQGDPPPPIRIERPMHVQCS
jgi:hypothetical protein